MKKIYVLTDGTEIYKESFMDQAEYENAQKEAFEFTDGELYWTEKDQIDNMYQALDDVAEWNNLRTMGFKIG